MSVNDSKCLIGRALELWKVGDGNPEEKGPYAEGDILMPLDQQGRNGLSAESARWLNGVIPFEINGNFSE